MRMSENVRSLFLFVLHPNLLFAITMSQTTICEYPFENGPDLYYDYFACSTVVDWSRFVTNECRQRFVGYEVQLVSGCEVKSYRTSIETFNFTDKSPGECSVSTSCFARIRAQAKDGSWSLYSSWIGISDTYKMVTGIILAYISSTIMNNVHLFTCSLCY